MIPDRMSVRDGKFTRKTADYLEAVESRLQGLSAHEIAERVRRLVEDHETWRGKKCLNLDAAETVMSRRARRLLASDLATRVSEGFPGDKDYPAARQNVYIDEIEAILISLAKKLFRASYVDWRPVSTSMANASALLALTRPGDVILSQRLEVGGNFGDDASRPSGVARLEVSELPTHGDAFEVDVEAAHKLARELKPRIIVIGGSNVLFPYPVRELRDVADESQSLLLYDGAHVGLLIAAGIFQDPLGEGADLLTLSTHRSLSGAVGGLIVTNHQDLAERVLSVSYPTLIRTRDQNKYAATAHVLAEMLAFASDLAPRAVKNAKALGRALEAEGFRVLAARRGYTQTHQIFLELEGIEGKTFETRCQEANILISKSQNVSRAFGGQTEGARLSTQEITRQGLEEEHMPQIARLIRRAVVGQEPPSLVARYVGELLEDFYRIRYSFDE
ncbi:MAG TPA: hypothetical protein VLK65_04990 [Vicinamibacteria bacterium]|nr:hypothetical protein [Vicinamibacteria bacterium]